MKKVAVIRYPKSENTSSMGNIITARQAIAASFPWRWRSQAMQINTPELRMTNVIICFGSDRPIL